MIAGNEVKYVSINGKKYRFGKYSSKGMGLPLVYATYVEPPSKTKCLGALN